MPTKERTSRERRRKAAALGRIRNSHARLSQGEIAARLGITRQAVKDAEERALRKLRDHPLIQRLAAELFGESD